MSKKLIFILVLVFVSATSFAQDNLIISNTNISKLTKIKTIPKDSQIEYAIMNQTGQFLALMTIPIKEIQVWDILDEPRIILSLNLSDSAEVYADFVLMGDYFFVRTSNSTTIYNLLDSPNTVVIQGTLSYLASSPKQPILLFTRSESDSIEVFDLDTQEVVSKIEQPSVSVLLFSPDGSILYGGDELGNLWKWQIDSNPFKFINKQLVKTFDGRILGLNLSSLGTYLLVNYYSNNYNDVILDLTNGQNNKLEYQSLDVTGLYRDLFYVYLRVGEVISIWNVESPNQYYELKIANVNWSSTDSTLITGSLNGSPIQVVDIESGQTVFTFPETDKGAFGSGDGRFIVTMDTSEIHIWGIKEN